MFTLISSCIEIAILLVYIVKDVQHNSSLIAPSASMQSASEDDGMSVDAGTTPAPAPALTADPTDSPAPIATTPSYRPSSATSFQRPLKPYEYPPKGEACLLMTLPDELLAKVFTRLDRVSLSRCLRVSSVSLDQSTNQRVLLFSSWGIQIRHA